MYLLAMVSYSVTANIGFSQNAGNGDSFRLQVISILTAKYVDSVAIVIGVYLLILNLVDWS